MHMISFTVKNGRWVSDELATEPDGTVVNMASLHGQLTGVEESPASGHIANGRNGAARPVREGINDEDRPETPEEIERWIAEFEALPPVVLSPEDEKWFEEWTAQYRMPSSQAMKEFNL